MNRYLVTASLKSASCYNRGYEFEVVAKNSAEAIKSARKQIVNHGHTRQDGSLTYRAVKQEGVRW